MGGRGNIAGLAGEVTQSTNQFTVDRIDADDGFFWKVDEVQLSCSSPKLDTGIFDLPLCCNNVRVGNDRHFLQLSSDGILYRLLGSRADDQGI